MSKIVESSRFLQEISAESQGELRKFNHLGFSYTITTDLINGYYPVLISVEKRLPAKQIKTGIPKS